MPMRTEVVLYIPPNELQELSSEMDFLLRRTFGPDLTKYQSQLNAQIPRVMDFMRLLCLHLPDSIDKSIYFPGS